MSEKCTCGRTWTHCRICGSKGVYRLQGQSEVLSARHGRRIDSWKCRRCMSATSELDVCTADVDQEVTEFVSKQKAEEQMRKLPLEQRLHAMIEAGASVDEVKKVIEDAGLKVITEGEIAKPNVIEVPKPKEEELDSDAKELGFTRDSEGKLVAPFSIDDFLRKKKEASLEDQNENNNQDKP